MADLALYVDRSGRKRRVDEYEDGDVLEVFTPRRTGLVHAQHICGHRRIAQSGKVPAAGTLERAYVDIIRPYRRWRSKGEPADFSETAVDALWQIIERDTAYRRADHTQWPATPTDLRAFLFLKVDDVSEAEEVDIVSPLTSDTTPSPENPDGLEVVKRRKHGIAWRSNLSLLAATVDRVLDRQQVVDLRGGSFLRSAIVTEKSLT